MVGRLPTLLDPLPASASEPELHALRALAQSGFAVAPMVVVPAAVEQEYYRLNNLEPVLKSLFAGVDVKDPDDDDIEEIAPEAERLFEQRFLLEEFIDHFYEAIAGLPERLVVRRPEAAGMAAARGRPSLIAVKRVWAEEWSFHSLWTRLQVQRQLIPEPRVLLVHGWRVEPLPSVLSEDASALLGRSVQALGDPDRGIARLTKGVEP